MSNLIKRGAKRSPVKVQSKNRGTKNTSSSSKFSKSPRSGGSASRSSFGASAGRDSRPSRDSRSSFGAPASRDSRPSFRDSSSRDSRPSRDSRDSRSSFGGSSSRDSRSSSRDSRPSFRDSSSRDSRSSSSTPSYRSNEVAPSTEGWTATSFPKARESSSSSFGGGRSSGGFRGGRGGRGGNGGGRSSSNGGGRRGFKGSFIDERMFVNKATKTTELDAYEPKNTFADFDVTENLAKNLKKRGYIKPSPIQDESIPVALSGKDVIGIAATGTGKTAAFLIPLINKVEKDRDQKVMILTPTRELALQVQKEFFDFTENMNLFSVTCVGGSPIYPQMRQLGLGVHVVVGTPGRVKDLIARGKIKMSNFSSIVLDEADRMLDMGFIDDMREILAAMPRDKQGLFFSATFNDKVRALCNDFLNNPVSVSVKTRDTSGSVEQDIVRVIRKDTKVDQLHDILNSDGAKKVLIFREMKRSVDELTSELTGRGIKVLGLHGDMRNRERERAVHSLKEGHVQAIIATDVAARGIHISDITHVINYDLPNDYETYIHRIGRTGRGSAKGIALTFVQ